ncbi:MAG TPA: hypothetical protein VH639_20625 [Bryobacteraceae bacterium]|jgi:hypothetical protein
MPIPIRALPSPHRRRLNPNRIFLPRALRDALASIFGPENVGSVTGVVLTAWSAAAVTGPMIITELSRRAKAALAPSESLVHIYDKPLEVLATVLAIGFVLSLLVRPLKKK